MARVPAPMEVRTLLEDLLGRSVEVGIAVPWAPMGGMLGTYAIYTDDSMIIRSVGICDIGFSAHAGAAIGLMPPTAATEAIEEKVVAGSMAENLYEVLNICAALQNVEGAPHMKLHAVHHIGEPIPTHVAPLAGVLGQRLDLSIKIAGYGDGRLSFVGVA